MQLTVLSTVMYALVFALVYFAFLKEKDETLSNAERKNLWIFFGAALVGIFVFQLVGATWSEGYPTDYGLFRLWTSFGDTHKVSEYYTTEGAYVDYPPVYLYVLFWTGKLARLFGVSPDSSGYLCFIKGPAILCDALTSILICKLAREKVGERKAVALALLSAVNPANLINSTVWGQVDSFSTLTIAAVILCLYSRKYVWAAAAMGLSFMTKPQNVIFMPVFGMTFVFDWYRLYREDKRKGARFTKTVVASVAAFVLLVLAVCLPITGGNLSLIVERYQHAVGLYPYTTLNAANLYGAIGANALPDSGRLLFMSYKSWGFFFIFCTVGCVIFLLYRARSRNAILFGGAFTVGAIYLFAHNMHERYLYPILLLLMLFYIFGRDKRVLWLYLGFSLTHFWNVEKVLELAWNQPENPYFSTADPVLIVLSLLQLVLFFALVRIGYGTFLRKRQTEPEDGAVLDAVAADSSARKRRFFAIDGIAPRAEEVRTTRLDLLLMASLMLVYGAVAFYRLGSTNTPQTGWYPEKNNESVVLEFEEAKPIRQFYIHYGWMDRRYRDQKVERVLTLQSSTDGVAWGEPTEFKISDVFLFQHFLWDETAKYVRLSVDEGNVYVNEVAFYGREEAERFLPVRVESPSGNGTAELLIDEPERMVYHYSWYDETYFDEIYHPRTAYEFITHRYPFENTHPPLGKFIISLGMRLFGVTPFGWRFFGALSGVLMIPFAYLLGKKMFRKSLFGFFTAFLFTFDFMHLSQTRLATIDSFTTLFVMGMYYYMYLYYKRSFYYGGVRKTLYPLMMSGLFFALGIATKWQGFYAGAGLAALFFMNLGRRYLEYRYAKKSDRPCAVDTSSFPKMAVQTLLFASLFFVAIPAVVYFLSYIPAMQTPSTGLSFFFENQSSMFRYHSTLNATHPYGSPWWSWPLDLRPLLSYTAPSDFLLPGMSMGMASFGNPLVWWMILPAVAYVAYRSLTRRGSSEATVLLAGFAAMYGPWILVTRVCFIYHFFPVVIFGVLAIVYAIRDLIEQETIRPWMAFVYLGAVLALFCLFYPVLTGVMIPRAFMQNALRWLPSWSFG